jgi:hypothetical protein
VTIRQFLRAYSITIGTTQITDLRCAFVVEKNLKPSPNKVGLRVWGLGPDKRAALEASTDVPIQIDAGYLEGISTIFLGRVRNLRSRPNEDGLGWITEAGAGDGEQQIRSARAAVSLAPGTSADLALRDLVRSLGVSPGNVESAVTLVAARKLFASGGVLFGAGRREMSSVCLSLGLEWSVQDGALQILERGKALEGRAIFLSPTTGLIGAPSQNAKREASIRCLLQPDIAPGRIVVVDSETLRGQFRIEKTTHKGDTHGAEWEIEITGTPY